MFIPVFTFINMKNIPDGFENSFIFFMNINVNLLMYDMILFFCVLLYLFMRQLINKKDDKILLDLELGNTIYSEIRYIYFILFGIISFLSFLFLSYYLGGLPIEISVEFYNNIYSIGYISNVLLTLILLITIIVSHARWSYYLFREIITKLKSKLKNKK